MKNQTRRSFLGRFAAFLGIPVATRFVGCTSYGYKPAAGNAIGFAENARCTVVNCCVTDVGSNAWYIKKGTYTMGINPVKFEKA